MIPDVKWLLKGNLQFLFVQCPCLASRRYQVHNKSSREICFCLAIINSATAKAGSSYTSNHNQLGWRCFCMRKQAPPLGLEEWDKVWGPELPLQRQVLPWGNGKTQCWRGEQESETKKGKMQRKLDRKPGFTCVCTEGTSWIVRGQYDVRE